MEMRYGTDQVHFQRMNTEEIRQAFLIEKLFEPGVVKLVYSEVDRAVAGSVVPGKKPLTLPAGKELAADYFAQRREIGVLNIGEAGKVTVDGKTFEMDTRDGLYIGRESKDIRFENKDPDKPAKFYLVSFPAHRNYPTTQAKKKDAAAVSLGSMETANKRTIYKYIHPAGIQSCQLVMGFTELAPGSVWNTMPAHTHERRMEVYLYFAMDPAARVFHLMGPARETRHIVVANEQAIISPSWSIHSGVGTGAYTFCWGMGGENQVFDDMDGLVISDLK